MKMSVHIKFGLYVIWITVLWAGFAISFYRDIGPYVCFWLIPLMGEISGPKCKDWHESEREVSDRALIIGFFVCFVVVWVGGITLAHHISPLHPPPKFLICTLAAGLWLVCILRAYRQWHAQKTKADAS